MKKFFKQLFCNHGYDLIRWHWTHGINGNEPRIIEAECKCKKCNKVRYIYPLRGGDIEGMVYKMSIIKIQGVSE